MNQDREHLGEQKISEIGGALGEKMIGEITRFHPAYAAYIKDSVAALQTSPGAESAGSRHHPARGTDYGGRLPRSGQEHGEGDP